MSLGDEKSVKSQEPSAMTMKSLEKTADGCV
jgi:hypothetical protein